jgi:peptide/nickel transport system substrate-binding protein
MTVRRSTTRRLTTLVALALALTLTACAGDDDDDSASSTSVGASAPTPADSAAATTSVADTAAEATSGASTSEPADGTRPPAPTLAPIEGDVDPNADVTFSYAVAPVTLDPHRSLATGGGDLYLMPLYDRLLWLDDDFNLQPMLATDWEFAEDGSSLTLTLRDDATFTDGSPVDSNAVKANLDRARSLEGGSQVSRLTFITGVEAPDPTHVVVGLEPGRGAELPALLVGNVGMIMNPKAFADPATDLTTAIGTGNESGPFTVVEISPGQGGYIQYERRSDIDQYWDQDAARIARLRWQHIPTGAQRINAVRAGDINMGQVTGVDVQQAKQLVDTGQAFGELYRQPLVPQVLWLRATRPPLDNLKLRQGIQLALDKESITQGLFGGTCTPSNQDYPAGTHWASDPVLDEKPMYDPDAARRLVQESGVEPSFTMIAAPTWQAQAQAVQQALAEVGINVTLEAAPTTPGGPTFANGDFDAQQGAFALSPDPGIAMSELYFGNIGLVPEADRAPYADWLAELANPVNDQATRAEAYHQIAERLYDEAYAVNLCFGSHIWLHDGTILNESALRGTRLGLVDVRHIAIGTR